MRGVQVQASVQAVESRNVPTAGAAPARSDAEASASQRSIELVGLALGIGFITAVALGHSSPTTSSGRWRPGSG